MIAGPSAHPMAKRLQPVGRDLLLRFRSVARIDDLDRPNAEQ